MAFKLTIITDNDAFTNAPDNDATDRYARQNEVARILRGVAHRLETGEPFAPNYETLRDINGNDVGGAAFKDNEQAHSTDCKCCT